MEFFADGSFVRLQSRVHGTYLHADTDGESLTLRPERASLNAAWRVHQIVRNDIPYVLLYGAAYGRYLAATNRPAELGLRGKRAVQGYYNNPGENAVAWVPARVADLRAPNDRLVLMQNVSYNGLLRCNGKIIKWVSDGVSIDSYRNRSAMMHWVVEIIPPHPGVPIFPPPGPAPAPQVQPRRSIRDRLRGRPQQPTTYRRTIRYKRSDAQGNFIEQPRRTFQFQGLSAYNLREAMAYHANESFFFFRITLCAWGGPCGRLTPLTADLPLNQEQLDVVALTVRSPPEAALRYPNVAAP